MNQEPQSPLWTETETKTTAKPIAPSSFGEKLKRERELRSITLDEIANSTKIGTRMLHALEDEAFCKLPGGIFNKGFVRAYAKYLGIDEEQAVVDFLAAEAEQERKRRAPLEPDANKSGPPQLIAIQGGSRADNVYNIRANVEVVEQQPDQAGGFLMAAVILVFVLGIGGFGWKYYNSHFTSGTAAASTPTDSPKPIAQQIVQPPIATTQSSTTTEPATTLSASQTSTLTESAAKPPDVRSSPSFTTVVPETSKPALSSMPAAVTSAEFTLDLRADEDSWAQVTADGKKLWSGVVSKDASKSFHASKQLVVKLGNAPAVQLAYNGKPLPRFSQDSKTRTLTFTPEGLSPY